MRIALVVLAFCASCTFDFDRELEWSDLRGTVVFVDDTQQTVLVEGAIASVEGAALSVRSDARGRFVLRGLPAGTHTVLVSHVGGDGVERGARLRVVIGTSLQGAGDGADLGRITIGRLGSLSGTVTWEGEPAPDVRVVLNSRDAAITDGSGVFRHEKLLPGTYGLTAVRTVGGLVQSSEHLEVEVAPGKPVTTSVVLSKVEGSALVSGVALVAGLRSHTDINVDFFASTGETFSTRTDQAGLYLDTLPVGEYRVVAHTSGFASASLPHFVLTRDAEAPTLLLVACPEDGCEEEPSVDTDEDGVLDDVDNCPEVANADQADWNEDGVGDACGDSDEDGVLDDVDNCREVANADQADWNEDGEGDACSDVDLDGVSDDVDNCREVANAGQADWDEDGTGDACSDSDEDGVFDDVDSCRMVANPGQEDWNLNGVGDVCEDSDGDLLTDAVDNCREVANGAQFDRDGDGQGDACDRESGLCGEDWCFEFPTPGPSGATAVEASSTGDLWVSYRKLVAARTPQGWRSSHVIGSSFNGTFDTVGEVRAMELVTDDELYIGGTSGLAGHYEAGTWSVDLSSSVSPETIHSMLGTVYAFTGYGHSRLDWPAIDPFNELDPQSVVSGVATLPGGLTFVVHNLGIPFVTTDALTFDQLDDPSLDLANWMSGGGAIAFGSDAFLVGTGENGGMVIQVTEGGSGLTYRQFELPGLWSVDGVAGTAHDDVWVYGRSEAFDTPMLLHFDGITWQRHPIGVGAAESSFVSIVGLAARSPDDAELVLSTGLHLRWDSQRWSSVDRLTLARMLSIAATGPGDAWAVDSSGGLYRWISSEWRPQPLPGSWSPSRVVAVAPDDVWALGARAIWRFDGQAWRELADAPTVDEYEGWYGVWVGGPQDVWLWSWDVMWRYDGVSFISIDLPGGLAPSLVGGAPGTAPWAEVDGELYRWSEAQQSFLPQQSISGVFQSGRPLAMVVRGEDDLELIGAAGECLRWDGSSWQPAASVLPLEFPAFLTDVQVAAGGTTWAVSSWGELLSRPTASTEPFEVVASLTSGRLEAVSAFGDEVWAAGDRDVYLGPDGQSIRMPWEPATSLRYLWLSSDESEGLAMDQLGTTLSKTTEGWVPADVTVEASSPVRVLAGTSTSTLRGLSQSGELLHFDGSWRPDETAPSFLLDLWARSATEFWAVDGTSIYRDTGSGWQVVHNVTSTSNVNLLVGDETRLFAAGADGVVTFDGTTWGFESTDAPLVSMSIAKDTGELFAVESGAVDRIVKRSDDGIWSPITIDEPSWFGCNRPKIVAARSSTEIWLAGPDGGGSFGSACPPFIGRFDGTAWKVDAALPRMKVYDFFQTTDGLWAVGNDSAILRLKAAPEESAN